MNAKKVIKETPTKELWKKNVVGVGSGIKISKGEIVDNDSIVIAVDKKKPLSELNSDDSIPERIKGVRTDVVEVNASAMGATRKVRPFMQGDEIGPEGIGKAGTLGLIMRVNEADYGLTNHHVLANVDGKVLGIKVNQPGGGVGQYLRTDVNKEHNLYNIGTVVAGINPQDRIADAALIRLEKSLIDPSAPDMGYNAPGSVWDKKMDEVKRFWPTIGLAAPMIGFPHHHGEYDGNIRDNSEKVFGSRTFAAGFGVANPGDSVWKSARTTGIKEGVVVSEDMDIYVSYGSDTNTNTLLMKNQCLAGRLGNDPYTMCLPGDSGSCVMDSSNFVVGLFFAGSPSCWVYTPIRIVLLHLFGKTALFGYNLNTENGWNMDLSEYIF